MAKNDSSILSAIQHVKRAKDYFEVFYGQCQSGHSRYLIRNYCNKLDWVLKDMLSEGLGEEAKAILKEEYASDVWAVSEIQEKIPLIPAGDREMLLDVVNLILSGEKITILDTETIKK